MEGSIMRRILALAAVLVASAAVPANAQISRFTGNWVNPTGGLVRVAISPAAGTAVNVRIWGKCSPTPCDWGTRPGLTYSPNVSTNPTTGAIAVTSSFPQSFARRTVVIRPVGTDRIEVSVYTEFTDNSGRSNYVTIEVLRRT
jgi:hypothetical protein